MKSVGALCIGVFLFAALVLGVAAPSAVWALTAPNVVHPTDPGSVLIFHKFLRGTVSVDGTTLPQSSFEISVTCPPGLDVSDKLCTDVLTGKGKTVYLKAKWVCPPQPGSPAGRFYCAETDFVLQTTVFGTVWINPENIPNVGSPDPVVATPACDQGFLIVWAIDGPVTQQPINFNGLLGDAILRPSDDTHVLAYNAVANQSFADVAPGLPVPGASKDFLPFDGTNYRYFTRKFYGTVRYEDDNTKTFLTLLTPNTQANNAFNDDNFIEFNYYNENEELVSRGTDLICWQEVEVPSSTEMNGLKGLVSVRNTSGPPILGIISTQETIPYIVGGSFFRGYAYSVYMDRTQWREGEFSEGDPPAIGAAPVPAPGSVSPVTTPTSPAALTPPVSLPRLP